MRQSKLSPQLASSVAAVAAARLTINVSQRMVYPFLSVFARGMQLSVQEVGQLLALRFAAGLLSPFFGPLSDRYGRRSMMVVGLILLAVGSLLALFPAVIPIAFGFLLMGLAKAIFDPSLYAYLGDKVPYDRRAKVIALVELAWGSSMVLGPPIVGWIISQTGWRSAFLFSALLAGFALLGLLRTLPFETSTYSGVRSIPTWSNLMQVARNRSARAAIAVAFLMMMSSELQIVVYGPWLESTFGLSVSGLGLATVVIGAAEIFGELGAGRLVDRWGKRRSVAGGLLITSAIYLLLPAMSTGLGAALSALFALFLFFEFSIVANLPLVTELVPEARASMMSLMVAALALGRMVGAWVGPWLWAHGGMKLNSIVAGFGILSALALLLVFVQVDKAKVERVTLT